MAFSPYLPPVEAPSAPAVRMRDWSQQRPGFSPRQDRRAEQPTSRSLFFVA